MTENTNFLEPAFFSDEPIYYLQSQCTQNSTFLISFELSAAISRQQGTRHLSFYEQCSVLSCVAYSFTFLK